MNNLLKGKVAVVTGGTRGIGYAIVKKYLEAGAITVLCGSREETAMKALEKIKAEMPEAQVDAIWPNLSDRSEVSAAFEGIKEKYGSLDILANNAGISQNTPLFDYKDEDFDKILNLNQLLSVFSQRGSLPSPAGCGRAPAAPPWEPGDP